MGVSNNNVNGLTRREFLNRPRTGGIQIASLLIQAWPEQIPQITAQITAIPGAETHGVGARGQVIVTLEMDSDNVLVEVMSNINDIEGVISVSLVYHQIEDVVDVD